MAKATAVAKVFSSVRLEANLYSKLVQIADAEKKSINELWHEAATAFVSNHPLTKGE